MINNILLIVNPCSGKKRGRKSTKDIIHFLSDENSNITVKETAFKGHAAQLAEQFGRENMMTGYFNTGKQN
ncbi:MAG: diacylglycerol kinase family protein [Eubacterium sp.]